MDRDEVRRRLVADGIAMLRWSIFGGHDEGCLLDAQTFDASGIPVDCSMTREQLETFGSKHAMALIPGFGNGPETTYGWIVWAVKQNEVYLLREWDNSIWSYDSEIRDGIEIYLTDPKFFINDGSEDDKNSYRDFYVNVKSGRISESCYEDAFDLIQGLVSVSKKGITWMVTLDFEGLKRLASDVDCDLEFDNCYISLDWECGNLCSQGGFDGKYFRFGTNRKFERILIFFDANDSGLHDPVSESSVIAMNPNPSTLIERAECLGPLK